MRTTKAVLAVALCLAVTTVAASAQGLSYESRGYGGPLYVGPNFQQGGQHAPPVYGQGASKAERATTRRARAAKSRKAPATREATTEKSSPAATEAVKAAATDKAETENSTISSASLQTGNADAGAKAEPTAPPTCKRFIAAVGQTVTVPCD